MPEAAKGTTKKSAEAFVRYAVEVLNYGTQSLQPSVIRKLGSADCAGCRSLASYVAGIRAAEGSVVGGDLKVQELFVVGRAPTNPRDLLIQVRVQAEPQTVLESRTAKVIRHPGGPASFDFTTTPNNTGWRLSAIEQVG